jgi:epoxyqueuosine reductase
MLKQRITEAAAEAGFDLAGFASVGNAPEAREAVLRGWLGRGFHAGMAWMETDPARRADPARYFPGARTILSLALDYQTPAEHRPTAGSGMISRHAWGRDYHKIIGKRLERLLGTVLKIAEEEGVPSPAGRSAVDTAPIMEKHWAQQAGLGWIGKHSCLITKEAGSWVFLAELILNFDVPPDAPETDQCGNCSLCVEACPTGALDEPYVVDSNRCISYRTIEHRGEMPRQWAEELHGWLFGCDICQDVCPYNRGRNGSQESPFMPVGGRTDADLGEITALDEAGFRARFAGTPVTRARLEGLRRNAKHLLEGQ